MANGSNIPTLVISLVPSILQFVETIFSHKPNSGAEKFGAAVNLTQSALTQAAAAGALDVGLSSNLVMITDAVQKGVDTEKAAGKLGGNAPHTNVAKPPTPPQAPKVQTGIHETVQRALQAAGKVPTPGPGGMQPIRDDYGNVKPGVQPNQSTTSILDAQTRSSVGLIGKPKQSWEK